MAARRGGGCTALDGLLPPGGVVGTRSIYEGGSMRRSQNITFCSTFIKIVSETEVLTDTTISAPDICDLGMQRAQILSLAL